MSNYIKEGMSWGEIVNVLNNFLSTIDTIKSAIGGAIIDGKIDYNTLANRPKINGKTITGEETTQSLGISIDNETVSLLRQAAETIARQTTTVLLENKASANLDNLQNADANVADICFFINDKNGVAKKIDMATLKAYLLNNNGGSSSDIIVNNGGDEDLSNEFQSLKEDYAAFKSNTALAITQIEDTFKSNEIAISDCSGDTCVILPNLTLSNNIKKP